MKPTVRKPPGIILNNGREISVRCNSVPDNQSGGIEQDGMPFVSIDWSRFGQTTDSANDPLQRLRSLMRPAVLTQTLLGLKLEYAWPKKQPLRILYVLHRIIVLALAAVFVALTALQIYKAATCSEHKLLVLIHCFMMTEGLSCFLCLLIWSWTKQMKSFEQQLSAATTGIAINRHYNFLKWTVYASSALFSFIVLLWTVYDAATLLVYAPMSWIPNPYSNHTMNIDSLNCVLCVGKIYLYLCWVSVHVITVIFVTVVVLELYNTNNDLKEDGNSYQTPVIKHYIMIHYRLVQLVKRVDKLISIPVIGLDLVFASVVLSLSPSYLSSLSLMDLSFLILVVLTLFLPPVFLLALQLCAHVAVSDFQSHVQAITSSDKRLDLEVHSVSLSYLSELRSNPPGFSIGTFVLVSKSNLIKLLVLALFFYVQLAILYKK